MRQPIVLVAIALSLPGCGPRPAPREPAPSVELGDLSTSLDAARAAFNAHASDPRFLTILSPT